MPNRQTWDIVFSHILPSGTRQLYNASIKVYFEDENKTLAYFDSDTLKWWDEMNEVEMTDDELEQYASFKTSICRTLDAMAILPRDIKFGHTRGLGLFTAFRKARSKK